jgi:hypothetical protein
MLMLDVGGLRKRGDDNNNWAGTIGIGAVELCSFGTPDRVICTPKFKPMLSNGLVCSNEGVRYAFSLHIDECTFRPPLVSSKRTRKRPNVLRFTFSINKSHLSGPGCYREGKRVISDLANLFW